jgi:cholest-4-en-3-one 26-monooxygenase
VYYVSANRDGDVFERPDEFDVGCTPNERVAFGMGPSSASSPPSSTA